MTRLLKKAIVLGFHGDRPLEVDKVLECWPFSVYGDNQQFKVVLISFDDEKNVLSVCCSPHDDVLATRTFDIHNPTFITD